MSLTLRWRLPPRSVPTRWRGPLRMLEAAASDLAGPLAAIIGPPGPAGPPGATGPGSAPLRIDAALSATWVLAHPLGRVPTVQVFLSPGVAVLTDVTATATEITVTFAVPQQGFVLAF